MLTVIKIHIANSNFVSNYPARGEIQILIIHCLFISSTIENVHIPLFPSVVRYVRNYTMMIATPFANRTRVSKFHSHDAAFA